MKTYKAIMDNTATYLQDSEQMDEFIKDGYFIYREDEDGTDTLVYFPGMGFLVERPVFGPAKPKEETYSPELIAAVRAFLIREEEDGSNR